MRLVLAFLVVVTLVGTSAPSLAQQPDPNVVDIPTEVEQLNRELSYVLSAGDSCVAGAAGSSITYRAADRSADRTSSRAAWAPSSRNTRTADLADNRAQEQAGRLGAQTSCAVANRQRANSILSAVKLANSDPAAFKRIVLESRAAERDRQARRAATFTQNLAAAEREANLLRVKPPKDAPVPFLTRLESLEGRLLLLGRDFPDMAGPYGGGLDNLVEAAAAFRVSHGKTAAAEAETIDIVQLERNIALARERSVRFRNDAFMREPAMVEIRTREASLKAAQERRAKLEQDSQASWQEGGVLTEAGVKAIGETRAAAK